DPRGVGMDRLEAHPEVADERRMGEEFAHQLRPGWQTRVADLRRTFDVSGQGKVLGRHCDSSLVGHTDSTYLTYRQYECQERPGRGGSRAHHEGRAVRGHARGPGGGSAPAVR